MARERRITGHVREVKLASGTRLYFAWRDLSGKQHQQLLGMKRTRGKAGGMTVTEAEEKKETLLADLRRAADAPVVDEAAATVTFADASNSWLLHAEHGRNCKHSTLTDYRLMVRTLDAVFGERLITAISADDVTEWVAEQRDDLGWSNRTAQKYITALFGIFERARKKSDWGLTENPIATVERPRVRNAKTLDVYSASEVGALVAEAADEQDAAIFLTAAQTGLRMGELLALRWRAVDFASEAIRVERNFTLGREDTPKSDKPRIVPMVPGVAQALAKLGQREHHTSDGDLVFCDALGRHRHPSRLRTRYYQAQEDAGLRRLTFHGLRHTFGSIAVNVADSLVELAAWMGHADLKTTARYLHYKRQGDEARRLAGGFEVDEQLPALAPAGAAG